MGAGRPRKYSKKFLDDLAQKFSDYIDKTDMPVIARFAIDNDLYKQFFYDYEEFSDLLKKATTKKEAYLEEQCATGSEVNVTFGIFSLKQLGWRDKFYDERPNYDEPTAEDIDKALGSVTPTPFAVPANEHSGKIQNRSGGKAKRKNGTG